MGTTNGKVPGRVKYTFAFGALGKDLIYGKMWCGILRMKNVKRCI